VLATVVRIAGSAYRRPGARMIFPAAGEPAGFVSGGCLEADLAEQAARVLASGEARSVVYDMRSPDDVVWGSGLGCSGEVRVLLERLDPAAPPFHLDFLGACAGRRRPGVLATCFEVHGVAPFGAGDYLTLDDEGVPRASWGEPARCAELLDAARRALAATASSSRTIELPGGHVEALLEYVAPPVALYVFGAGSDARPLVRLAAGLGWRVHVLDSREAYATAGRFPEADAVQVVDLERLDAAALPVDDRSAAIVMTHHFLRDRALIGRLLGTELRYVGLLGPRQRTLKLLAELAEEGRAPAAAARHRLHGPAGLDVGSETPEEIALSVLAEIQAVLQRRRGGFLRDRSGPLHDWPAEP
jgi:xanthine/CO dehydrogenase XdhC/CoxF family maturation factor